MGADARVLILVISNAQLVGLALTRVLTSHQADLGSSDAWMLPTPPSGEGMLSSAPRRADDSRCGPRGRSH
jgi:hypothetical protein